MAAINEIVKKDMKDPIDGKPLKSTDIIEMQRGGTGFAGAGVNLQVEKYSPALMT